MLSLTQTKMLFKAIISPLLQRSAIGQVHGPAEEVKLKNLPNNPWQLKLKKKQEELEVMNNWQVIELLLHI